MSAINFVKRRDGLYFFSDGAQYLSNGILTSFGSKLWPLANLPAIIAARGSVWAGPIFSWELGHRFSDFDELIEGVETSLPALHERHLELFGNSGRDELELYLGGWSN